MSLIDFYLIDHFIKLYIFFFLRLELFIHIW